jgi:hypothetical protein
MESSDEHDHRDVRIQPEITICIQQTLDIGLDLAEEGPPLAPQLTLSRWNDARLRVPIHHLRLQPPLTMTRRWASSVACQSLPSHHRRRSKLLSTVGIRRNRSFSFYRQIYVLHFIWMKSMHIPSWAVGISPTFIVRSVGKLYVMTHHLTVVPYRKNSYIESIERGGLHLKRGVGDSSCAGHR